MSALELPVRELTSVPEPAHSTLANIQKQYGFIPNLYGVFANAPIILDAYIAVNAHFQKSSFTATERNVVLLAVSRENGCRYCVAVHSSLGDMQRDEPAITNAIRDGKSIDDPRLEALRALAQALVRSRGHADAEVKAFLAAGYRPEQVLEVIVGVALKTMSNYTNHLAHPPLDAVFTGRTWVPPGG